MSALQEHGRDIIVIGTSAGGLEALDELITQLPAGFPASIFIVQHMAPENTREALLQRLGRQKNLKCSLAVDGEPFKSGRIDIAPADSHLLLKKAKLLVAKGAREYRYRPAVVFGEPGCIQSASALAERSNTPQMVVILLPMGFENKCASSAF